MGMLTITTILVFILATIWYCFYLYCLKLQEEVRRAILNQSRTGKYETLLEDYKAIKKPAEKTTPVPFAQFSLNPEFKCPVCKEAARTDDHHQVIFCSYCRTPHHVNCYKSIGHCSTYGCPGQKDPATYQMPCECL